MHCMYLENVFIEGHIHLSLRPWTTICSIKPVQGCQIKNWIALVLEVPLRRLLFDWQEKILVTINDNKLGHCAFIIPQRITPKDAMHIRNVMKWAHNLVLIFKTANQELRVVVISSQEWLRLWVGVVCPAVSSVVPTAMAGCGRRGGRAASSSPRSGNASGLSWRDPHFTGTLPSRWVYRCPHFIYSKATRC